MNKSVLAKVLLLSLCVALVLVAFVGCGKKKFEDINQQIADTNADLKGAKDENTETKLALEQLRATVNEIKKTADAAATATQLEAAVTELKALVEANATADAATKAELQAAIADVTALLNTNSTTDAATKAELETAIGTLATKASLAAAVDALNETIATLATKTELEAAVEDLTALVDANAVLDAQTKEALEAKADELKTLIDANTALDAQTKAALEADIDEINEAIDAINANKADKTALEAAVTELNETIATLATKAALETAVEDLTTLIEENAALDLATKTALQNSINTINANKADKTALNAAVNNLNTEIDNLATATETALEAAVEELTEKINANTTLAESIQTELLGEIEALEAAKADKTALEAAVTALNETIATLATKEELADAVETLENAIEANTTLANGIKDELLAEIADLAAVVDGKATKAELEAAVDAIEDTIATLATKAELTTAVEQLTGLIEANTTLANGIKDQLLAEIEALEAVVETKATKAELGAAVLALETAINDVKTDLEAQITALTGSFDTLSAKVDGNVADISALNTELDAIKDRLAALEDKDFALDFKNATILLRGDDATYSLKAFNAVWDAYEAISIFYAEYDAFDEEMDRIEFYLLRAASVEEVKSLIDNDLAAAIADLEDSDYRINFPAWLESFIGNVTVDTDLSTVIDVYNNLPAEVQADNAAEYNALLTAQAKLVEAQALLDGLNADIVAIGTVIYNTNTNEVADCRNFFETVVETYFAEPAVDAEVLKYYATGDLAIEMLGNYDLLLQKEARVAELDEAYANAVAIIDAIANYNTARPLFSDLEAITANKAAIEDWIAEYALEDVNVEAIYTATGEYDAYLLVDDALAYADAMKAIYDEFVLAEVYDGKDMATVIADLKVKLDANTMTLSADEAVVNALMSVVETDLLAGITAVTGYDPLADNNYLEMIGDYLIDYAAITARIQDLNTLKDEIADLVADVETAIGEAVDFADYTVIETFRTDLDALYATYNIVVGDDNYVELATEAEEYYAALRADYEALTAEIKEIYLEAMDILNNFKDEHGNIVLKNGNDLLDVYELLTEIVIDKGLTEVVLPLDEADASVNIENLYNEYFGLLTEYAVVAEDAQDAAATLKATIFDVLSDEAADLNNYDAITAAYAALVEWYKDYIDAGFAGTDADMRAELDLIDEIEIFDGDEDVDLYVFVTLADFDRIVGLKDTAVATYADAEAAATELKADMAALNDEWDIFSDFATVDADFVAFLDTYYAGAIAGTDHFDVINAYADFVVTMTEYTIFCEDAEDDAADLKVIFDALGAADDLNNYEAITDAYAALIVWYETYVADFTTEDEMLANIVEIADTAILGSDPVVYYVFVSADDCTKVCELNAGILAHYDAAEEVALNLIEVMNALIGNWNIHSNFEGPKNNYDAFVSTFYNNNLNDVVDFFDVIPVYTAFAADMADYTAANTAAQDKADEINNLIAALPDGVIDMADGQTVLDDIYAINTKIVEFYAITQCDEGCELCIEKYLTVGGVDNDLKLYRITKRALLAKAYYEVYLITDPANYADMDSAKKFADRIITNAANKTVIDAGYTNGMNRLDSYN